MRPASAVRFVDRALPRRRRMQARRLVARCSSGLYLAHVSTSVQRGRGKPASGEGRRFESAGALSPVHRLAPSPGLFSGSNGIQRQRPRIDKRERGDRRRGFRRVPRRTEMRFAGIDIASEHHVVAVVDLEGRVVEKATTFAEDAAGYQRLLELLGEPAGCVVAMEATGHYWQNLFAALAAAGFAIALINP